jgi:predicted metalloprotease with PDZ domain
MLWMDFDARIREATDGQKSLDDFCAAFFSHGEPTAAAVSFDQAEIVGRLNDLVEGPWDSLINARTEETQEQYNPEAVERCGYRLGYTAERSDALKASEKNREAKYYAESLGFNIKDDGVISKVVPGGPAEEIGLYDGVQIVAVDGLKFTQERLEHAVRHTPTTGEITLLTLQGETFKEVTIEYDGGLRYRTLIPIAGQRDWLSEIIRPKTATN